MRQPETVIFISVIVLVVSFVVVSGCFVTNCPPGGKRSGTELITRQCEQCGPSGMKGRCYGPRICCSELFGCFMGTSETLSCLKENQHSTLCHNPGNSCSDSINGQCAANGLCCSTETCTFDENCQRQDDQGSQKQLAGQQGHSVFVSKPHLNMEHQIPIMLNPMETLFPRRFGHHFTLQKPYHSSDFQKNSQLFDTSVSGEIKIPVEEEY